MVTSFGIFLFICLDFYNFCFTKPSLKSPKCVFSPLLLVSSWWRTEWQNVDGRYVEKLLSNLAAKIKRGKDRLELSQMEQAATVTQGLSKVPTGCSLNIVFFFKICDFSELCQFCCSAGVLPALFVYTHWHWGKTENGIL